MVMKYSPESSPHQPLYTTSNAIDHIAGQVLQLFLVIADELKRRPKGKPAEVLRYLQANQKKKKKKKARVLCMLMHGYVRHAVPNSASRSGDGDFEESEAHHTLRGCSHEETAPPRQLHRPRCTSWQW